MDTFTETPEAYTAQALIDLIHDEGSPYFGNDTAARSYEEASIMTTNEGLVLRTDQGEFQITVVQSR